MGYERSTIDGEWSNRTVALAAEFGRMITAGDLLSGDALPTEKEIQSNHGVSRTVVREAIRHLAAKGLVSVGPKVGTKVRGIRLVDGDHDIDCKVPGVGPIGLKSQFVKKVAG